jgi:hypothetical protein
MTQRAVSAMRAIRDWTTAYDLGNFLDLPLGERNALSRALRRAVAGDLAQRRELVPARECGSKWEYRLR